MTELPEGIGLGEALRLTRVAAGLSQDRLARELRLTVALVQAIETEQWHCIPPGRERPLTRLVARHLRLDLTKYKEAFETLPGGQGQNLPNPQRERLERILTAVISLACLTLLAWLVVPGKDLRERMPAHGQVSSTTAPPALATMPLPTSTGPYPVLGEVLPETPVTPEGILVSLRAMDTCEATIKGETADLQHSLRISEPWIVRAKGPFTLSLNNAGVVLVEVAGRRIHHGRSVGEAWSGDFGEGGALQLAPKIPKAIPPSAPDADPEVVPEKTEE